MSDNPNKKKLDRKRVSKQPHEVAYQNKKTKLSVSSSASKRRTDKRSK